jgi:hypothetical protein
LTIWNKIHQGDKTNGYKWDGKIAGKNIPTGTYWYQHGMRMIKNTPFKFSGWIVVKTENNLSSYSKAAVQRLFSF